MAGGKVENVALRGLACAVPDTVRTLEDEIKTFGREHMEKWVKQFHVHQRYFAAPEICTSDLCFFAAEKLLDQLGWERASIDLLLFASTTSDYVAPATSCILQHRLGLPKSCATLDITHPCSGYTYGLWTVANLLSNGNLRRALLLVGDTNSRVASPQDRSFPLAGDGGSASAVEWDDQAEPMFFEVGSDGGGARDLLRKAGSNRHPSTEETRARTLRGDGSIRSDEDLAMKGAQIFAFSLREVPPLANKVLAHAGWTLDNVNHVILHQANLFMIRAVAKKIGVPPEKQVECVDNYGNIGGATICFAMADELGEALRRESRRLVLLGFGTGLSWGGVALSCGPLVIPDRTTVRADDVSLPEGL